MRVPNEVEWDFHEKSEGELMKSVKHSNEIINESQCSCCLKHFHKFAKVNEPLVLKNHMSYSHTSFQLELDGVQTVKLVFASLLQDSKYNTLPL